MSTAHIYFDGGSVYAPIDTKSHWSSQVINLEIGSYETGRFSVWLTPEKAREIAAALVAKAEYAEREMATSAAPAGVNPVKEEV